MKRLKYIGFCLFLVFIISCKSDEEIIQGEFEFINQYPATITVGGFVGITKRTFETGEVYKGTDEGGETITIRIAQHSDLNEDCPNSWCYQEFLEVPRKFLRLVQ